MKALDLRFREDDKLISVSLKTMSRQNYTATYTAYNSHKINHIGECVGKKSYHMTYFVTYTSQYLTSLKRGIKNL